MAAVWRLYSGYMAAMWRLHGGYVAAIWLYCGYMAAILRLYGGYLAAIWRLLRPLYSGYTVAGVYGGYSERIFWSGCRFPLGKEATGAGSRSAFWPKVPTVKRFSNLTHGILAGTCEVYRFPLAKQASASGVLSLT